MTLPSITGLTIFESALGAACPAGVDVYFDNTAGPISDSVMRRLAVGARMVICGTASIASWDRTPQGPRAERHLLVKRARMQGFLIFDHVQRSPEALRDLQSWVRDGQIRSREDILDESSRHRVRSQGCTAARISASA